MGTHVCLPHSSSQSPILKLTSFVACTASCLANATSSKCSAGEVKCLCEDSDFINSTTTCFQASCDAADLAKAEKTAQDTCALAVCLSLYSLAELDADGCYVGCYHFIYSPLHHFTSIWSYGGWQLTVTNVPPKLQ